MLPVSPQGLKSKMAVSLIKVDFFRRKSPTKYRCVKTVSSKVVGYSLAYLTVHKWFVGDVPLNVNIARNETHKTPTTVAAANANNAHKCRILELQM